ncbi:MAG: DJ-1/PfpI family protein [Nanoarchaeota archaeon]|nr:DJ-1/PfpI family protein [Nanoarchaeota archaeon]
MAKVLMIIAPKNFRDEELFHTKEELEKEGNEVTIASTTTEEATGMLGGKAKPEITIDEVNVDDYDAIVFVGGTGASIYFENQRAHEIAKQAYEKGKVVAAICIAPSTLANAGILKGKMATSWPSEETNLLAKGASYTGDPVTVDGKIVTANGPTAARNFGRKIAELLK